MLPIGADISLADVVFADNTAANFTLTLTASGQDVSMGVMPNQSILAFETLEFMFDLEGAITSLLNNPLLQVSYVDEYGNDWATFQFEVVNSNAASGSHVVVRDLDIIYDWSTTLGAANNFDRELNQGIALGTGADVDVPLTLSAGSEERLNSLTCQSQHQQATTLLFL